MKKFILCFTALILLANCSGKELPQTQSAKDDYLKARQMLKDEEYAKANTFLEEFTARYPYSQYAIQAELLRAFAAYKDEEYILSETLSEQFLKRHPRHPDVVYAKYLLAMNYYKQVAREDRDQSSTKLSVNAFETLINEYPESSYAKDAIPRLQSLYNKLSLHELTVGKYYFDKERYVAAVNRFQIILEKHQTTPAIEEALYYLTMSYVKLGITESAHETALLLHHNFPNSKWSGKVQDFL